MIKLLITAILSLIAIEARAETVAIIHGKAWTGAGPVISDATIVMAEGRIVSLRAGGEVPAGARVIDAGGRIVTPAVMSGATHLGLIETRATNDSALTSGLLNAAFDIEYALNANSMLLPLARADGLSRALTYPASAAQEPFAGIAAVIRLDDAASILDKPEVAVFARVGALSKAGAGGSRAAQWIALRTALTTAAKSPEEIRQDHVPNSNVSALQSVMRGRMKLAIFTDRESDLREAIRLAQDLKISIVIMGGSEAWRVRKELAAAHIPVVLDPLTNIPQNFDDMGIRLDNAALLDAAGVSIAFTVKGHGSQKLSHNVGLAIREGAGLAVAYGLSHDAALKAITINPAKIWGIDDHYGTLAAGKDADVVIWDGDPLEPSTAPVTVFIRGHEVSLKTRQTALRDRYHPSRKNDLLPPAYRSP